MNQMPVEASGWVLIKQEVIPDSRSENFENQKQLLEGYFEVPKMMDAILFNIITYASEGKHPYGEDPLTYMRCQEMFKDYPITCWWF